MNTNQTTAQTVDYSVKETAAAMRKALRAAFPGIKFSVRMSTGTAHGWLTVSWADGPIERDVMKIGDGFRSLRFDGMDDAYHQVEQTGPIRYTCSGVNYSRRMGEAGCYAVVDAVNAVVEDSETVFAAQTPYGSWRLEGITEEISAEAARRLDVSNYFDGSPGDRSVPLDLVQHQIFARMAVTA